jgi:hypothetical protein
MFKKTFRGNQTISIHKADEHIWEGEDKLVCRKCGKEFPDSEACTGVVKEITIGGVDRSKLNA